MSCGLAEYVGANDEDNDFIFACEDTAEKLVEQFCGEYLDQVPSEVLKTAKLEVGSELYHRRNAPNGVSQYADFDGVGIRIARNPMLAAYSILKPFLPLGFA